MNTAAPSDLHTTIPLHDLKPSPLNVRTTPDDGATSPAIDAIAASIMAHGLLQNLVVYPDPDQAGYFCVAAGGRRLQALMKLANDVQIPSTFPVPCLVTTQERALELSLAENHEREDMHPADRYEAFAKLAAKGLSETEIAVRFGEEPGTVTRLLRLGNVAPEFLEQYRRDEIQIDVVIALATTTDHELQRQAFKGAGRYAQPSQIKQLLTKSELSADRDRLAKYVAAEYRKAGGGERPDIFSADGEVYFTDIPLVQRLAKEKLQRRADQLKKDGWAWAEVQIESPNLGKYSQIHGSWDGGKETFTPAQKGHAGCIVQLGWNGKAEVHTGLVRKADVKALNDAIKRERKESGGITAAKPAPQPKAPKKRATGEIPFAALQQLQGLRTAAVRLHLARDQRLAIAALAAALVSDNTDVDNCVKADCKIDWQERPDRRVQDAIESTEAAGELEQLEEDVLAKVPAGGEPVLEWLLSQPIEVSLAILTMVSAKATVTADKLRHNPDDPGSRFAGLVGLDFADVWQPNAEWLASVPRNVVLDAVEETCGKKEAKELDRLRKEDFATRAEQLLQGKRWIPRQMRPPAPKPARTKKPKTQKGQMAAAGDVPVAPAL
ncbi:ParB/RepB/Spo0J family partition protein [uncultured Arenimonas sp.]|mgnify:CR=1 FL=1|uniref:ParB/RepB/Spo0J family partition protein n=1 Tax=uncultured Arenimonas sp. TaxID=546226 RepID=UPI0030DB0E9A